MEKWLSVHSKHRKTGIDSRWASDFHGWKLKVRECSVCCAESIIVAPKRLVLARLFGLIFRVET